MQHSLCIVYYMVTISLARAIVQAETNASLDANLLRQCMLDDWFEVGLSGRFRRGRSPRVISGLHTPCLVSGGSSQVRSLDSNVFGL